MDGKTFDALTRGLGIQRNRRDALKSLAAGLIGLGGARSASAQVSIERSTCGQSCNTTRADCNSGLRCSSSSGTNGQCVAIIDSRDSCSGNIGCGRDYEVCRSGRCVNQSTCTRCNVNADCPSGENCRNGNCGGCQQDRDCPSGDVCRNGRCERDVDECTANSDCRRDERCRRGRCVRRN